MNNLRTLRSLTLSNGRENLPNSRCRLDLMLPSATVFDPKMHLAERVLDFRATKSESTLMTGALKSSARWMLSFLSCGTSSAVRSSCTFRCPRVRERSVVFGQENGRKIICAKRCFYLNYIELDCDHSRSGMIQNPGTGAWKRNAHIERRCILCRKHCHIRPGCVGHRPFRVDLGIQDVSRFPGAIDSDLSTF